MLSRVFERVAKMSDEEYCNEDKIKGELLELQTKREMGEISEEQYPEGRGFLNEKIREG